jgi:hypothetical protein
VYFAPLVTITVLVNSVKRWQIKPKCNNHAADNAQSCASEPKEKQLTQAGKLS